MKINNKYHVRRKGPGIGKVRRNPPTQEFSAKNPPMLTLRTYIYIRPDGKCVHKNAGYGFFGEEYVHDDPNWNPPEDWPYEIIDMRRKR